MIRNHCRHYVHPKCSPSRAALLTGRYAWTMGRLELLFYHSFHDDFMMISWWYQDVSHLDNSRQRGAIERFQPTGLSTSIPLLPQLLKTAGYCHHHHHYWDHYCRYCHCHNHHHPIQLPPPHLPWYTWSISITSIILLIDHIHIIYFNGS